MAVPLLDLTPQHDVIMPELTRALEEVTRSGKFILGPYVEAFEQQLAAYCGVKHAIGVTSGTDALLVAMMAMGIGPGDEVITTPFTFFCTAGCVTRLGAKPVFVDINPRTYNIEVEDIPGAVTRATKAIIPVHLFGLSANMGPIMNIAQEHGLKVIEDAAQAIGARYEGQHVGSIGDCGTLSFYPSKNLAGLGDAGAVVTNDDDLADRIRRLRNHGTKDGWHYEDVGGNFRLSALQAAALSVKLPHLAGYIEKRRAHAERYGRHLEELPVGTPFEAPHRHHVFNQYTIRCHGKSREPLRSHLNARQIGNRIYYPVPLHRQPCYADLQYAKGSLPLAEEAADLVLSLPVFPEMTREQQDEVIAAIREFFAAD